MTLADILQSVCTCFTSPVLRQEDEEIVTATGIPTTPTNKITTDDRQAFYIPVSLLEDDVDQTNVFPVSWRDTQAELDLNDIQEIGAVVAKPEDVDQPEVHPINWHTVKRGSVDWGGEGTEPKELEAEQSNVRKKLPLPWEKEGGLTPVPFDKSITGPSYEQ